MLILKTFTEKHCYEKADVIGVLDKLRLNSLIYQDSEGKYSSELGRSILAWENQRFKKKALELLKYLKDNNRFLKQSSIECAQCDSIEYVMGALSQCGVDSIIINDDNDVGGIDVPFEVIKLREFLVSYYNEKIEQSEKIEISGELRKRDRFKEEILRPIIENSKNHIEIYDRFIGRSLWNQQLRQLKPISQNYIDTIRYIIECYLEISGTAKEREIKILTGIKNKRVDVEFVNNCFNDLMEPFKNTEKFVYRIDIREEGEEELDHDRYLFTNVFDYKFEEGFGFLHGNGISDFKITHIKKDEARKVKQKVKKLRQIYQQ